jgi:transcriptional regulator
MYKISHFTETDFEKVFEFMQNNSFAIVAGIQDDFPVATHVPMEVKKINDRIILTGHIMKNSDHYSAFSVNENVLVIFTGPHCYVSASWYVTKNVASTWNYMDVHAKGKIKFTDDKGTRQIIENITNHYEEPGSEAAFNEVPVEYVDRMLKAIIGFEIEVESLDNVFKLSQNRGEKSRKQIIENLRKSKDFFSNEIAKEMELRNKE